MLGKEEKNVLNSVFNDSQCGPKTEMSDCISFLSFQCFLFTSQKSKTKRFTTNFFATKVKACILDSVKNLVTILGEKSKPL